MSNLKKGVRPLFALIVTLISGLVVGQNVQKSESSVDISVLSYNIRYGTAADGDNAWEHRRDWLAQTINVRQPDLLSTQETLKMQREFLDLKLHGMESWGVGRDDGDQQGEMTAIWFRKDRFEKVDGGHFWLSESPDQPGSVSWDSSLTRMASWIIVRDRTQPQRRSILFLNTHFDHRGKTAREESAKLIYRKLQSWQRDHDIIVTGDFNAPENSAPYRVLFGELEPPSGRGTNRDSVDQNTPVSPALLRDTFRVKFPDPQSAEGTFSGFSVTQDKGPRIDWIGISARWQVIDAGIDRTSASERTPSDHFAVYAKLRQAD
jgi:endonuclease/exonuclease/phosphatase family metal-dependent hydrolase